MTMDCTNCKSAGFIPGCTVGESSGMRLSTATESLGMRFSVANESCGNQASPQGKSHSQAVVAVCLVSRLLLAAIYGRGTVFTLRSAS